MTCFTLTSGYLTIKLQPGSEDRHWTVYGDHDPVLGGWMSQTDEVTMSSTNT